MILSVYDQEKSVVILVPVTPDSTFVDVLRCCKGFSDQKYYITGIFQNREEHTIEPLERPYEFERQNVDFMGKFVIYKKEDSNIFLNGLYDHQGTKQRFTFTELANIISHHDKVIEKQNKAIYTMEEKLRKLRKEGMTKRREGYGLLTLVQSAEIHEGRISALRRQKGCPSWRRNGQGSHIGELKVHFRAAEEEMKRLNHRIDSSVQRIKTYTIPKSPNDSEEPKGIFGELHRNCETERSLKSHGSSRDINLKVNDLRNRLNLNKKIGTTSINVEKPQVPTNERTDRTRPKSAREILFSSSLSPSSMLPSTSSKFKLVSSLTNGVNSSSLTSSMARIKNSSNISQYSFKAVEHQIDHAKEESKMQPQLHMDKDVLVNKPHSPTTNSESNESVVDHSYPTIKKLPLRLMQAGSSTSKKRRQRPSVFSEIDSVVVDSVKKDMISMDQSLTISTCEHTADLLKPVKSHFCNDVQTSKLDDNIVSEINCNKDSDTEVCFKTSELVKFPSPLHQNKLENKLDKHNGISESDKLNMFDSPIKSMTAVSLEIMSEGSQSETQGSVIKSLNISNEDIAKQNHNSSQESLSTSHHSPVSSFSEITSDFSHCNMSSSCSPKTPEAFNSFVQVTPMSSDTPVWRYSNVFNSSGNQISHKIYEAEDSLGSNEHGSINFINSPSTRGFNVSVNDENNEESIVQKDDSFHGMPSFSSVSAEGKEINSCQFSSSISDHKFSYGEALESFSTSPCPYPLTKVLEQLDGSASIFRHSVGTIRSHRKRHSLDDFHHHNAVSRSSSDRWSFPCTSDVAGDLNKSEELLKPDYVSEAGMYVDFKSKIMPKQFFINLPLEATITSSKASLSDVNIPAEEKGDGNVTEMAEVKSNSSITNIIPEESQCKIMKYISSPLKEFNEGSTSEDEEPRLIVSGECAKISGNECLISSDEDNSTSTSDANNEDDDVDTSFSPLIDAFSENLGANEIRFPQVLDKTSIEGVKNFSDSNVTVPSATILKSILKKPATSKTSKTNKVVFSPLAILLDAALHGELDIIKDIINKHGHADMVNDEGITALHNAICAGHADIAHFLISSGCDINAADNDLWTPLHCAASCYNLSLVQLLVENGACVFAITACDGETALDKCEDEEEDGGQCKHYLKEIQSKMMKTNSELYAAYNSQDSGNPDELHFCEGDIIILIHPGQTSGSENDGNEDINKDNLDFGEGWCFAKNKRTTEEGYAPKNYLSLFPRVSSS